MAVGNNLIDNTKIAAAQVADQVGTWFEVLRSKIACWLQDLNLTPAHIIEIGSYLGAGFLVGFLLKKYFRAGLILVVLLVAAGWVLVEFDIVTINWNQAQTLAHVMPNDTVSSVVTNLAQWCKQHLVIVVSCLVGFLLGHKVG